MAKGKQQSGCAGTIMLLFFAWVGIKLVMNATDQPNARNDFREQRILEPPHQPQATMAVKVEKPKEKPPEDEQETKSPPLRQERSDAISASEIFVKRRLAHPSTASFPFFGPETVTNNSDGSWTIFGEVSGKNDFNLELTLRYTCTVNHVGTDWVLVSCLMSESK